MAKWWSVRGPRNPATTPPTPMHETETETHPNNNPPSADNVTVALQGWGLCPRPWCHSRSQKLDICMIWQPHTQRIFQLFGWWGWAPQQQTHWSWYMSKKYPIQLKVHWIIGDAKTKVKLPCSLLTLGPLALIVILLAGRRCCLCYKVGSRRVRVRSLFEWLAKKPAATHLMAILPSTKLAYPSLGKRNIIFKSALVKDMLVPWRVTLCAMTWKCCMYVATCCSFGWNRSRIESNGSRNIAKSTHFIEMLKLCTNRAMKKTPGC